MKHQWLAYGVVAVVSVGAGVAIAGLPDSSPDETTVIAATSTRLEPTTTVPTTRPTTTTTAEPTTTTRPPTTTTPPSTAPTTTVAPTTTRPASTTSIAAMPERSEILTAAANGTTLNGMARDTADLMEAAGYVDVQALTGADKATVTYVYYVAGFEESAARLATDLGIDPSLIAPIETAPPVSDLGFTQLLVYVGNDRR